MGAEADASLTERPTVRAILLTPDNEILLLRARNSDGRLFWVTPGGGIEEGETVEAALRREMQEELGLDRYRLGPLVWRRHHIFDWDGERLSKREQYHILHVDRFDAAMLDEAEAHHFVELKWWQVTELGSAPDPVVPASLSKIVMDFLETGPPDPLPPEEVLVDWIAVETAARDT
jgi:8-oxo-dGTP pyrophosphatase MutT (NUDIX family)